MTAKKVTEENEAKASDISKKKETADPEKNNNDFAGPSARILELIKIKNTKEIEAALVKTMKKIENSALVDKVERILFKFQTNMIKEGGKLIRSIKKLITTSNRPGKNRDIL